MISLNTRIAVLYYSFRFLGGNRHTLPTHLDFYPSVYLLSKRVSIKQKGGSLMDDLEKKIKDLEAKITYFLRM